MRKLHVIILLLVSVSAWGNLNRIPYGQEFEVFRRAGYDSDLINRVAGYPILKRYMDLAGYPMMKRMSWNDFWDDE